jgi:exodeoxyribonuclease V alpha subunit
MLEVQDGVAHTFRGRWEDDAKWGRQFRFESYETELPRDTVGIERYLMQNARWVGPEIARRLTDAFGEETLRVCKDAPARVAREIKGVSDKRADDIAGMLRRNEALEQVSVKVESLVASAGLPRSVVNRIIKLYREEAPEVIKANPYRLIDEVAGVGFLSADRLALGIGFGRQGIERCAAALIHVLQEAASGHGDIYLPEGEVLSRARELTGVGNDALSRGLEGAVAGGKVVREKGGLWLAKLYADELYVATKVRALLSAKPRGKEKSVPVLDGLQEDQTAAAEGAAGAQVAIVTGAPGVGKTFVIVRLVSMFRKAKLRVALCAPTGKAARRMMDQLEAGGLAGTHASTIHSLLGPHEQNGRFVFEHGEAYPLNTDVVIVDETSMVDVSLMADLLRAVPPGTRLVLVGDTNQLPSVGPGRVLGDLIDSGVVPSFELTKIKRQQPGKIVLACHVMKAGSEPLIENLADDDLHFLERSDPLGVRETICDLVERRLPAQGFDPLREVQVMSPLREKAALSCKALNEVLQRSLNPAPPEPKCKFKVGDKVIQTKNGVIDDQAVVNGDIGYVRQITKKHVEVAFESPERVVRIPRRRNDLQLAYALTCVSADTWVWTAEGMRRIAQLSPELEAQHARDCRIPVGTPDGLRDATRVIHVGRKPIIRIRTRLGLCLEASRDHRLLTADRVTGEEEWVTASRLSEGMRLPVPRGLKCGPKEMVSTGGFCPGSHPCGRRNGARWPSKVTEQLAEFMGALVSDGNYTDRGDGRIEFGLADPWRSSVRLAAEQLFDVKCSARREPGCNIARFYFHSRTVREFLEWCGLDYVTAPRKTVPWTILASPPPVQAAFLRGLFSGDGGVSSAVIYATSSPVLAEQVQLLLLNLGVVSKRSLMRGATDRWGAAWRVEIYGREIDLFNREVSFWHQQKREDAIFLRQAVPYSKTNWDTIPGGMLAARRLREALRQRDGRSYRASLVVKKLLSCLCRGNNRLAYHHVNTLVSETEDLGSLGPAAERFLRWQRRHWFYDEIVALEEGEADLYDLTVPGPHSYLSNGLVSHNCHKMQGSEVRAIVLPVHRCFGSRMMQRNLVYTAISRARELCVLVGERSALSAAIRRNHHEKRMSRLAELLTREVVA